jgi:hypothetical protein
VEVGREGVFEELGAEETCINGSNSVVFVDIEDHQYDIGYRKNGQFLQVCSWNKGIMIHYSYPTLSRSFRDKVILRLNPNHVLWYTSRFFLGLSLS